MRHTAEIRKNHIIEMYSSNAEADFSKRAKKVVDRHNNIRSDEVTGEPFVFPIAFDIENHDVPFHDIKAVSTKSGKKVRVGSNKAHKKHATEIKGILNQNFTAEELGDMNLYFEYPASKTVGVVALHTGYEENGRRFSIIDIASHNRGLEDTVTHEVVHARRWSKKEQIRDVDREESETELETIARISNKGLDERFGGYYQYLKHGRPKDLIRQDRALITGDASKPLRGKEAVRGINQKFNESNISQYDGEGRWEGSAKRRRVKMPGEDLDRYFEVDTPKRKNIQAHARLSKKLPIGRIITTLKKKYGKDARIYEWRDGKKVLIAK